MPSTHSRRTVLALSGAVLGLGAAGCLGNSSTVSDAEAKKRALAAEKEYLADRLRNASCLQNWGTTPTTSNERATVTGRTADGVRVEVHHPYSYSTDATEADFASSARYVVTADAVRRVDGDSVSPC